MEQSSQRVSSTQGEEVGGCDQELRVLLWSNAAVSLTPRPCLVLELEQSSAEAPETPGPQVARQARKHKLDLAGDWEQYHQVQHLK